MSSMSRNNSANPLMGFSVHQPTLGAPLQFFPAMGSKKLDEMIDAYVPGDASILDKRAAVTVEFFQYSATTGEFFKFFMVYPTLGSTNPSPTMDSGYHSNFTTSPVMSESQWSNTPSQMVSPSTKSTSANDFSNIPGMKIMTKDGRDVTNSASRGCKTKEQRDHAHLMRIIKACDSCKRKKTKCDPSHKRSAAGTSSGKITKKTSKNPRPAAAPPQIAARQASTSIDFDQILSETCPFDSFAESFNFSTDGFTMEWDQFIQYPEESTEAIPIDYDFFRDPAGFFSPATTASLGSSFASPSQLPITPIERDVNIADNTAQGHDHKPILPYLNPGVVEAGSNYVDFNLFSPQSSFLDEEVDFAREVAASPIQTQQLDRHRHKRTDAHQVATSHISAVEFSDRAVYDEAAYCDPQNGIPDAGGDGVFHGISEGRNSWSDSTAMIDIIDHGRVLDSQPDNIVSNRQAGASHRVRPLATVTLSTTHDILESVTSDGLYGRDAIYEQALSTRLPNGGRLQSPIVLNPTAYGTEHQESGRTITRERNRDHSSESGSITRDELSSSATTANIRGEEVVANIMTTSIQPTRNIYDGDGVMQRLHNIRSAAIAHTPVCQVPRSLESPLPSPIVTSTWNTRTSTSQIDSRETIEPNVQRTGILGSILASTDAAHLLGEPNGGSTLSRNAENAVQYHTGARQNFPALRNQLVLFDLLLALSVIASLGVFSLVAQRPGTARSDSLVKSVQPVVSGALEGLIAAALLFYTCIAAFVSSGLFSFIAMSALPILAPCIQLHQPTSLSSAKSHLSDHTLSHAFSKARHIDLIAGFKAGYANILRVVRCDLAKKLMPNTRPQTSHKARLSCPQLPRVFERRAVTSHV
ncbi:hypothetical protein F4678DRAFT_418385 [Xylaria arbuscula]|nr:hypothetical protein F4678DRAFT_418385 [Xylaria arbuscula]